MKKRLENIEARHSESRGQVRPLISPFAFGPRPSRLPE